MTNTSAGQKRRQKDLKRKRKQQLQKSRAQSSSRSPSLEKENLSSVLLHYAGPLLEMMGDDSEEVVNSAIAIASICWNIGNYPEKISYELQVDFISTLLDGLSVAPEIEEEIVVFMTIMIEGRRTIFNEDSRFVMDYEVLWSGNAYRLRIVSSFIPPIMFDKFSKNSFEEIKPELIVNKRLRCKQPHSE